MNPTEYRYPLSTLLKDYATAVIGLTVFGGPALFVPMSSVMVALFGGLALLFAIFAARTLLRQSSVLFVDEEGVRITGPWPRNVTWQNLSEVRLKFFSTWRDRKSGWMQLSLKEGHRSVVRIDQGLEGFQDLAGIVLARGMKRGLTLDENTRRNAAALGIDTGAGMPDEQGDTWE